MKYLVMECHTAYAVVLSDDGRFLKVANMRYEVGQTVTHVVEMVLPQTDPKKQTRRRWIPAVASMAACLVLVLGGFFMNHMPYASVYMAINPEVRIDVSRTDRVLEITGVNADGLALLEGYEPDSRDLDLVMDALVDRAIHMGYLHEGGNITLTLDANHKWVTSHETALNDHLERYLEDKISVTIDIVSQRQTQSQPAQNISDGQTAVIPVEPESDYGDSDYDSATESGDSDYDASPDSGFGVDGDSGYDEADSNYADAADPDSSDSDYGDSAYDAAAEDDDSGNGNSAGRESDSGYEEPEQDDDSDSEDDD